MRLCEIALTWLIVVTLAVCLSACNGGGGAATPPPLPSAGWQPNALNTFNVQLRGALITNVVASIYDIDLFDNSAAQIAQLKQQGHKVVCYFSAGSSENWRPDFASFLHLTWANPCWLGQARIGSIRDRKMSTASCARAWTSP